MFCNAVLCYVCLVGSSLGGCDRLIVVVVSGCVCLVAACTMKLNQYSILVIWGEGRCYTVRMWEGVVKGHSHIMGSSTGLPTILKNDSLTQL